MVRVRVGVCVNVGVMFFALVFAVMMFATIVLMLVLMAMFVAVMFFTRILLRVRVGVMLMLILVTMRVLMVMPFTRTFIPMRRTLVDAELYSFDLMPLRTVEVHVKIAEIELRQFPFESGRFHAEIHQGADGHVAADSGTAIEIEDFHGKLRFEALVRSLWCRGDN